mmetsp:Transcript_16290/g.47192  ORF Transcript_16290/g.47192 Transcript_16290/m.47192 type:complete len:226 (+) Transcript_16290:46-723(+)
MSGKTTSRAQAPIAATRSAATRSTPMLAGHVLANVIIVRLPAHRVSEIPACEKLLLLLEGVERHVRPSTRCRHLAASLLAQHGEDVYAGYADRHHTPIQVLVFAPRLRGEELALWQAFHICCDSPRREHLNRPMQAETAVVDVDCRRRRKKVSFDVAPVQPSIWLRGQVASLDGRAMAIAIHWSWSGHHVQRLAASLVHPLLKPSHMVLAHVGLVPGQLTMLATV